MDEALRKQMPFEVNERLSVGLEEKQEGKGGSDIPRPVDTACFQSIQFYIFGVTDEV